MARKVREYFSKLPKDTHDALADTEGMSTNKAYEYLENKKVTIVTPYNQVRKIIDKKSNAHKVPIIMSTSFPEKYKHKNADGVAVEELNGNCKIYIHPIIKYRYNKYIDDLIEHENDHVRVFKKRQGRQKPRQNKPSISVMR